MPKVIANTAQMTRGEWLEQRTKGIGGSDVSVILGINKYKTAFELWLEKTGQIVPEEVQSEAAYFGTELEDFVAREYERRTGNKVRKRNAILQHDEYDFAFANVDRLIVKQPGGLECKTASEYLRKEWEGEEVPAPYLVQCQHYMAVMDLVFWDIAVLIGGNTFIHKRIERDQELIDIILREEKHFWEHHVIGGVAPALDGSSAAEKYLKEKYDRADTGFVIDLKHEHKENIESLLELEEQKKALDASIKQIKHTLQAEIQYAEAGLVGPYRVNWKNVTSNRVDSKRLKAEFPEIYEKVLNESKSRRFEIKVES